MIKLIANKLAFGWPNQLKLWRDISFVLQNSQSLWLAGRNGVGKSTLLRVLIGQLSATDGWWQIEADQAMVNFPVTQAWQAWLPCHMAWRPGFSVQDHLSWFGKLGYHWPDNLIACPNAADYHIHRYQSPQCCSMGQQQWLKWGLFCRLQRPIWLLDEPDRHLDRPSQQRMWQTCRSHTEQQGLLLVAGVAPPIDWWGSVLWL